MIRSALLVALAVFVLAFTSLLWGIGQWIVRSSDEYQLARRTLASAHPELAEDSIATCFFCASSIASERPPKAEHHYFYFTLRGTDQSGAERTFCVSGRGRRGYAYETEVLGGACPAKGAPV